MFLKDVDFQFFFWWNFLEVKVNPVPGELFVVVGGREVLVPEVLVEGEDEAEVDEREDESDEAEVEQGLDEQLQHVPIENSQKLAEANFNL